MANSEHIYAVPDEDELAQLVGAATPHFAMQAHQRIMKLVGALPADHPRQAELRAHLARLEHIAFDGEDGGETDIDLPTGPSLSV
ncbi:MAG: hypothetical protein OER93_04160 [Thermoleophilia bacterium]|nr:hypothetical protein [Thermoleophilia bacterium]